MRNEQCVVTELVEVTRKRCVMWKKGRTSTTEDTEFYGVKEKKLY